MRKGWVRGMSNRGSLLRKQSTEGVNRVATGDGFLSSAAFHLSHTFLPSTTSNHGCRIVPQLRGGEGYEVAKEVWRVQVSDYRSFSREGGVSLSIVHFLTASQGCIILCMAACQSSGYTVLMKIWISVNRMSKGLVEDNSQIFMRVCDSSPISGG